MSQTFNGERSKVPGEHPGVFVSKQAYEGIVRDPRIETKSIRAVGGKVVIDYISIKNEAKGHVELNDLGQQDEKGK